MRIVKEIISLYIVVMDIQNTTIHNLSISLKEKREELDSLYSKLGARIFQDEDASFKDSPDGAPESYSEWKNLMKERETAASAVFEIKDGLKRLQDFGKVEKDLEKSLSEEKKKLRSSGVRAAASLWKEYTPERFPAFTPVFTAAKAEKLECEKLEEKQNSINEGKEAGKPLGRMMAHFRGAGVSAQLYYRRSRFEQSLADSVEALVTAGGAEDLVGEVASYSSPVLDEVFAPFEASIKAVSSLTERMKKVSAEKKSVEENLASLGVGENSSKRLDELRVLVKDRDTAVDNMCRARGFDYCSVFFDAGGNPMPEARDMESDRYNVHLSGIKAALADIADLERKIDVLQTEMKISSLDKNIKKYNDEIEAAKNKIENLTAQIEHLEKSISDASAEKAGLETYLGTISGREGQTAGNAGE